MLPHSSSFTDAGPRVTLRVETRRDRARLARLAEASLLEGEALALVVDSYSVDEARVVTLADPDATVVAREPPLVLETGHVIVVTYVRVKAGRLFGTEHTVTRAGVTASRDVLLDAETLGRRSARPGPAR